MSPYLAMMSFLPLLALSVAIVTLITARGPSKPRSLFITNTILIALMTVNAVFGPALMLASTWLKVDFSSFEVILVFVFGLLNALLFILAIVGLAKEMIFMKRVGLSVWAGLWSPSAATLIPSILIASSIFYFFFSYVFFYDLRA